MVNIEDILSADVTPLSSISISGMDATPCPDMSVAKSVSVNLGTSTSVDFKIDATAVTPLSSATETAVGAYHFRNPSLAPNVARANIGESPPGMHRLTAQGYTSLGDTASRMVPSTALGRYTDSDDIAQDRFWTRASKRNRGVDSGFDFSFTEFDSCSALDRYFAEEGTRRGSVAAASADVQVGPSPWTWSTSFI